MRFEPPTVELLVDGEVVGAGEVTRTAWSRISLTGAGLTAGWATDFSPADLDYRGRVRRSRRRWTASRSRCAANPSLDPEAEAAAAIAAQ